MTPDGTRSADRDTDSGGTADRTGPDGRPRLEHRVVHRPAGPNRCTVFPPGMTGVPRMSTWLSVNADCVVALEEVR
ncbi:MAG: hypothetical protein ACI8UR_001910 [Natronomonas sp.]|jgi:hypothetical protein|uniref:DUF7511 domain-containing protein n=1 Tax=Natronomonas sp. TaxID=2184060 RepID=UPI003989257A